MNLNSLTLCEKYKLAIDDIPNAFINFAGPIISDDKDETKYQSNFVFQNSVSTVIYEKNEKFYTLEIELYKGQDTVKAVEIMNSNIAVLDACLGTSNKQKPFRSDLDDQHWTFQDYVTENYLVEVALVIYTKRSWLPRLTISISKNRG